MKVRAPEATLNLLRSKLGGQVDGPQGQGQEVWVGGEKRRKVGSLTWPQGRQKDTRNEMTIGIITRISFTPCSQMLQESLTFAEQQKPA